MKIYLTGHGGHTPNDGFFNMPRGHTMIFYTMYAKLMLSTDVYKIINGSFKGKPNQIINQYMSCPNMTLYEDDAQFLGPTEAALQANPDKDNCKILNANAVGVASFKIAEIFKAIPPGTECEWHWCCCRDLSLNSTAKAGYGSLATSAGINAGEDLTGKFMNFDKATWNWQ